MSLDFFTVSTVRFTVLFVLIILAHDRRRVVHFNITTNPTAQWTGQQVVEAFPWDTAPRFLLRDRDGVYGADFRRRVHSMGIEEVVIAARSPWQSPYVERMIGSIRRECLDNVVVLGERHLRRDPRGLPLSLPPLALPPVPADGLPGAPGCAAAGSRPGR